MCILFVAVHIIIKKIYDISILLIVSFCFA